MKQNKTNNLELPEWLDKSKFRDWTAPGNVIMHETNSDDAFCVLVEMQYDDEPKTYQYQRYFEVGGKTQVSVDWDSTQTDPLTKIFELLTK